MRFEGEEVKVVALGTAWVAAITSLNFLRIFTEGGLQVCEISNDFSLPISIFLLRYMIYASIIYSLVLHNGFVSVLTFII